MIGQQKSNGNKYMLATLFALLLFGCVLVAYVLLDAREAKNQAIEDIVSQTLTAHAPAATTIFDGTPAPPAGSPAGGDPGGAVTPRDTGLYISEIDTVASLYRSSIQDLADLGQQAADNNLLLLDAAWKENVEGEVESIRLTGEMLRAIQPPAEYAATHASLLEAANHYDAAMDLYEEAMNTLSQEQLDQANAELETAGNIFNAATAKMN